MPETFLNLIRLKEGPWQAFERLIARYIEHGGFEDVSVVGGPGDGGADIVGFRRGKRWLIQAKFRRSSTVGSPAIKEAFDAQWLYGADVVVTATNQTFSRSAIKLRIEKINSGFEVYNWDRNFFLDQSKNLELFSSARRNLRDYQREAVNAIQLAVESGRTRSLVTLATGLGKTVVASTFIAEYIEGSPDSNVLVLAHMTDLVKQLERSCWASFNKFTETHLWTDGEKPAHPKGVTFATWQSVASAVERGEYLGEVFDLVVVDECHHAPSDSFSSLIDKLSPKHLLGVTATPWRGDAVSLRPLFGDPVFSMDVVQGMQEGYLSKVDYQMYLDGIDWDEIRQLSVQGLTVKDLNTMLYVPERDIGMIESVVDVIEKTPLARTLVFCRSIDHAERLQNFFGQYDIAAGLMHSRLNKADRFKTLTDFRGGSLKVLI